MIKVGIAGVTSYTGEELIDILLKNKGVEITSLSARVNKKTDLTELYPRFKDRTALTYKSLDVEEFSANTDMVFLALPHTVSMYIVPEFLKKGKKVIDLSADYRLPEDVYGEYYSRKHVDSANIDAAVYGLPELNREKIKKADLVANPGCYPTSIILALLPIMRRIVKNAAEIIVDSKSGMTGAGRKTVEELSKLGLLENLKCYKPNVHQHIPEMEHVLTGISGKDVKVNFVPHLLPIDRGILSTIYILDESIAGEEEIYSVYEEFYKSEPFVRIKPLGEMPEIKDVVHTNFCDIGITVSRGMLIIVSVIDNLLKGASGQAVQNMNIMYGLDETEGLV